MFAYNIDSKVQVTEWPSTICSLVPDCIFSFFFFFFFFFSHLVCLFFFFLFFFLNVTFS